MESTGSCDSVISVNSGSSEDSLEHFSADVRASLMYLEQTIEALEMQEDSGLSNDEPDWGHLAERMAPNKVTDVSSLNIETGMNHSCETLPLFLAELPAKEKCKTVTDKNVTDDLLIHTYEPDQNKIDVDLIPPPSDFMDDPRLVPEPNGVSVKAPPLTSSSRSVSVDLNQLYQRSLEKRTVASSRNTQKRPEKLPIRQEGSLKSQEVTETRRTSFAATKLKSLSNIDLRAHNTPEPELNSPTGNSKHHINLRKLGPLNGGLAPKTQMPWADLPSPSSPTALSPTKLTPSHAIINTTATASEVVPSPIAFNDASEPLSLHPNESPVKNDTRSTLNAVKLRPSPRTSSELVKQLTKASGAQPGLPMYADRRMSRPVSYHEGISVEQCLSHASSPDFRRHRSIHANFQQSGDSEKLLRSQGVSVMISPQDENGVSRRDTLKKLGLVRD